MPSTTSPAPRRARAVAVACALAAALVAAPAAAHDERPTVFPAGDLSVPEVRSGGPTLVVCKPDSASRIAGLPRALRERNGRLLAECGFEHLQDAVDAVQQRGTRILVLPGLYREEPSYAPPTAECAALLERPAEDGRDVGPVPDPGNDTGDNARGTAVLSYAEQRQCPHLQNLVGIFGDTDDDGRCDNALCDLQIEGTGARREDVILDGQYRALNGIRGDRADGLVLRNLTVQRFEFNAIYVLETDGFVFDDVVTRWNDEYGFLSFAVDHGLYQECEAYGNGDSGLYPGSASDLNAEAGLFDESQGLRFAVEIRGCRSHHNTLGYSGTAGNSVFTHNNELDHNTTGFATDSLFPDHPGLPQDHAYVRDNLVHSNNVNYYRFVNDGVCTGPFAARDYDEGVVCPVVPLPVGSGIVIAGGNYNLVERNRIYDNWRQGVMQFFVPAALRDETDPAAQFDTSNFNTHRNNLLASNPNGAAQPNGVDFWWDGEGEGNCWEGNTSAAGDPTFSVNDVSAPVMPACEPRMPFSPAVTVVTEGACATYNRDTASTPSGCDWMRDAAPPAARQPEAPTIERVAGPHRVATGVAAAQEGYPHRAAAVVLARADSFADALAGAPLAAAMGGPVLLTGGEALDATAAAEIRRLAPDRVVLLGGRAALGQRVEADVLALGIDDVTRVAGSDRYATAVAIARLVGGAHAYLAKGSDVDEARAWPDALAVSALAAHQQRPILLTAPDGLPAVTRAFLAEGAISDVRVVGGPAAIAEGIVSELAEGLADVERLSGPTRYETSLRLAEAAVLAGADPTQLWLATGEDWPDALAAGAAATVDEGVLLLAPPAAPAPDDPLSRWLATHGAVLEDVRVLGGVAALPDAVVEGVTSATGAVAGDAEGDRSAGTLVTSGRVLPLPGAPSELATVSGSARALRTIVGSTRVDVTVRGLVAPGTLAGYVGTATCADGGGAPARLDEAGPAEAANEVRFRMAVDDAGVGLGRALVYTTLGPEARSVVVAASDGRAAACADLTGADIPVVADRTPVAAFLVPPRSGSWSDGLWAALTGLLVGGLVRRRSRRVAARAG